jgi:hypothetical protein
MIFRTNILIFLFFVLQGCGSFINKEDEKLYLKKYVLLKLDGQSCNNCIVDVQEGHFYVILKEGKEIGRGKWELGDNIDFPTNYLKLENGPNHMIYNTDTVIEFISR